MMHLDIRKFWDWVMPGVRRNIWQRLPAVVTDTLRSALNVHSPLRPQLPIDGRWLVQPTSAKIRDTDSDWREIASREPLWGVITDERYKASHLDDESRHRFFAVGRQDVQETIYRLRELGARFPVKRALDFGCGVGRMLIPMRNYANEVCGVDVAPAMLDLAALYTREFRVDEITLAQEIPPGTFDWINSYAVFQHIDPRRGYPLLNELLSRTASRGYISLNFTICRSAAIQTDIDQHPLGTIEMYDYDASQIIASLFAHGFESLNVQPACDGPHVAILVFARRLD